MQHTTADAPAKQERDLKKPRTFYDIVKAAAAEWPDAPALDTATRVYSYQDLLAAVTARASQLQDALGDGSSESGILVSRADAATIIDHVALNAAGITIVPVHADAPDRIARLVAMTEPSLFIDHGSDKTAPGDWNSLDSNSQIRRPSSDPARQLQSNAPVILFTSGSTGTPKGVPVKAESLESYFRYAPKLLDLTPGSRSSHTFSLAFDLAMIDLYATWSAGATLVLPSKSQAYNPIQYIEQRQLTHWASVPSAIDLIRRSPSSDSQLRVSMFCGEELRARQVAIWHDQYPATRILNLYGPTELTISCTSHEVDVRDEVDTVSRIPIGTANPDTSYIVIPDDSGEPNRGELCMRGVQRFDGYFDDADNAGRFVDEHGATCAVRTPVPDELFYRTGDIVVDHDGVLTYRGRADSMVKVRGYRVELGELETAARAVDGVREAAAVVEPSAIGDVLCLVVVVDAQFDEAAARERLGELLPRYMLPKSIRLVDSMPLNSNGKIDRKALSAQTGAGSRRSM